MLMSVRCLSLHFRQFSLDVVPVKTEHPVTFVPDSFAFNSVLDLAMTLYEVCGIFVEQCASPVQ